MDTNPASILHEGPQQDNYVSETNRSVSSEAASLLAYLIFKESLVAPSETTPLLETLISKKRLVLSSTVYVI